MKKCVKMNWNTFFKAAPIASLVTQSIVMFMIAGLFPANARMWSVRVSEQPILYMWLYIVVASLGYWAAEYKWMNAAERSVKR